MKDIIATIQLAQGRVGFYDELSRIHLTLGRPTANVTSGTNCARLRRAVRDGVIRLVDGTLGEPVPPFKVVEVDGKFKLATNVDAEMRPVFKEELKLQNVVASVKGIEAEDGGSVKDAVAEKVKAEKSVTEDVTEQTVEKETEKQAEEDIPKKKTSGRKKKVAKE